MPIFKHCTGGLLVLPVLAVLTGCQVPGQTSGAQALQGGTLENAGGVIEEPGVFRIANGQNFQTPFSVDCTRLNASVTGWQDAVAAGAHRVLITLPGQPRVFGGVLALCKVDPSATGPSSRSYSIVIPADRIPNASDGLIASVAEKVAVNRSTLNVAALLVPTGQPAVGQVTEDYAWMLWFSDQPSVLGVTFAVPEAPPVAMAPTLSPRYSGPSLVKNAAYKVTTNTSLHAAASHGSAELEALKVGETVTANGTRRGSYWSVTAADGQSGWVASGTLVAN